MERRRKVIDSNIPCDSKTRGRHANNLHRSPRHPVFTIVFRNLNGSDISVVRDELSTRDKFYILPPLLLPASFPIRLHTSLLFGRIDRIQIVWSGLSFRQPSLRSFDTGQIRIIYPIEIFKTQIILPLQFCLDASTNRGFSTMIWGRGDSIGF